MEASVGNQRALFSIGDESHAAFHKPVIALDCNTILEWQKVRVVETPFAEHADPVGQQIGNPHDFENRTLVVMDVNDDLGA